MTWGSRISAASSISRTDGRTTAKTSWNIAPAEPWTENWHRRPPFRRQPTTMAHKMVRDIKWLKNVAHGRMERWNPSRPPDQTCEPKRWNEGPQQRHCGSQWNYTSTLCRLAPQTALRKSIEFGSKTQPRKTFNQLTAPRDNLESTVCEYIICRSCEQHCLWVRRPQLLFENCSMGVSVQ